MAEFFFEYGLFAAKVITFILVLLIAIVAFVLILSGRERDNETIEIEKINDKFDAMRDALEAEVLSKEELKALKKQRKKEEKDEEKAHKKKLKEREKAQSNGTLEISDKNRSDDEDDTSENDEMERGRLFVLRFMGDMQASEVESLREAITSVVLVAKPSDEVLVILDSAGGLVHNYGLGASQLRRLREHNIPLTVSVDLVAASGGYMMACVANKIIAAPFAVVGSIGVLAQIPNFNRLLEKYDVDIEQHTAGEFKTTLTMLGKNTDKARRKFQEELEDTHVLFKRFVKENRPILDIDKLATGEHWYGTEALNLKLIDEVMTSDDYLLNKSKHADIYEVNYLISESLSEKLSTFFHGMSMKLLSGVMGYFRRPQH